jgi:hypothetical protein
LSIGSGFLLIPQAILGSSL